jgi:hypothetical protein
MSGLASRSAAETAVSSLELAELARGVIRPTLAPFGAYVFGPSDPGAALGRAVEAEVFFEAFGNTPELLAEEYDPYAAASLQLVVMDHRRLTAAGSVRLILPCSGTPGLKSLNDLSPIWCDDPRMLLAEQGLDLFAATTFDWATLAVSPEYRTAAGLGLVSLGLYQTVMTVGRALGCQNFVAILDRAVYVMSRLRYVQPFVPIAPAKPYLGSAGSLPVYLPLDEWEERLRIVDPDLDAVLFERRGIEPALDPVPVEDVHGVVADESAILLPR